MVSKEEAVFKGSVDKVLYRYSLLSDRIEKQLSPIGYEVVHKGESVSLGVGDKIELPNIEGFHCVKEVVKNIDGSAIYVLNYSVKEIHDEETDTSRKEAISRREEFRSGPSLNTGLVEQEKDDSEVLLNKLKNYVCVIMFFLILILVELWT